MPAKVVIPVLVGVLLVGALLILGPLRGSDSPTPPPIELREGSERGEDRGPMRRGSDRPSRNRNGAPAGSPSTPPPPTAPAPAPPPAPAPTPATPAPAPVPAPATPASPDDDDDDDDDGEADDGHD